MDKLSATLLYFDVDIVAIMPGIALQMTDNCKSWDRIVQSRMCRLHDPRTQKSELAVILLIKM